MTELIIRSTDKHRSPEDFDGQMKSGIQLCSHGVSRRNCPEHSTLHGLRSIPDEYLDRKKDMTQLSYGPGSVQMFVDPDAATKARKMLLWTPTAPGFAGSLDDVETRVWAMSIEQVTQTEIATAIGRSQSNVPKIMVRCVRKLNERFLCLRAADALPIEISAWILEHGGDADSDWDIAQVVEWLRGRDKAIRRGNLLAASTGCRNMDDMVRLNC
jgi:hypothetical protein